MKFKFVTFAMFTALVSLCAIGQEQPRCIRIGSCVQGQLDGEGKVITGTLAMYDETNKKIMVSSKRNGQWDREAPEYLFYLDGTGRVTNFGGREPIVPPSADVLRLVAMAKASIAGQTVNVGSSGAASLAPTPASEPFKWPDDVQQRKPLSLPFPNVGLNQGSPASTGTGRNREPDRSSAVLTNAAVRTCVTIARWETRPYAFGMVLRNGCDSAVTVRICNRVGPNACRINGDNLIGSYLTTLQRGAEEWTNSGVNREGGNEIALYTCPAPTSATLSGGTWVCR